MKRKIKITVPGSEVIKLLKEKLSNTIWPGEELELTRIQIKDKKVHGRKSKYEIDYIEFEITGKRKPDPKLPPHQELFRRYYED